MRSERFGTCLRMFNAASIRPFKRWAKIRARPAARSSLAKNPFGVFESVITASSIKSEQVPVTENAQEFLDCVKVMAYSGCRRNEALGLQWDDVDFENAQLHVRRQVTNRGIESLKHGEERTVDFNPKLGAHLEENRRHARWPRPEGGSLKSYHGRIMY